MLGPPVLDAAVGLLDGLLQVLEIAKAVVVAGSPFIAVLGLVAKLQ